MAFVSFTAWILGLICVIGLTCHVSPPNAASCPQGQNLNPAWPLREKVSMCSPVTDIDSLGSPGIMEMLTTKSPSLGCVNYSNIQASSSIPRER